MTKTVISVENLSKSYRLGQIGTGTLSRDLEVWWAKVRGKPNPLLKIGQTDHGNQDGQTLWALQDVSFQVQQGEVLGIIGRNGAGKSTLLKILSRVTAPTSGQVKVKGRIASLLEVGTGFHPELTGRENIFLNGAILGMSRQEVQRKFDEIVSFAEVEKFVDTPVKRYSSGMYVRLAFAVAAHLESEILLVDEVLAVGDAEFQKKCIGKMGDVATNEGRTVLFVSHNMNSIQDLCYQTIWIDKGQIKERDTSKEVIKQYLNSEGDSQFFQGIKVFDTNKLSINSLSKIIFKNQWNEITNQIYEFDPFFVEIFISIIKNVKKIQIGCGVTRNDLSVELFTIPSEEFQNEFSNGQYRTKILINPNLLREGEYSLTLKLFIDGKRIATERNIFSFRILKKNENSTHPRWINGPMNIYYDWEFPVLDQQIEDIK